MAITRTVRREFFDLWIEIQIADAAGQMLRCIQLALHKGPVDHELRTLILKAGSFHLHLLPHRLQVPLHVVPADREDVHEAPVFRLLGEHGREHARNDVAKLDLKAV